MRKTAKRVCGFVLAVAFLVLGGCARDGDMPLEHEARNYVVLEPLDDPNDACYGIASLIEYDESNVFETSDFIFRGELLAREEREYSWLDENGEPWGPYYYTMYDVSVSEVIFAHERVNGEMGQTIRMVVAGNSHEPIWPHIELRQHRTSRLAAGKRLFARIGVKNTRDSSAIPAFFSLLHAKIRSPDAIRPLCGIALTVGAEYVLLSHMLSPLDVSVGTARFDKFDFNRDADVYLQYPLYGVLPVRGGFVQHIENIDIDGQRMPTYSQTEEVYAGREIQEQNMYLNPMSSQKSVVSICASDQESVVSSLAALASKYQGANHAPSPPAP